MKCHIDLNHIALSGRIFEDYCRGFNSRHSLLERKNEGKEIGVLRKCSS